MTSTFRGFRVAICGGGIGGLTLAVAMAKYAQFPVEIFEAGPTITTTGAGIVLYARAMDIMKELGLYDELVKMALRPPQENSPNFRKSDQQDGYHWFRRDVRGGCLLVHRQDLVNILLRHIPSSCKIQISKKLEFYEVDSTTDQVKLHFSDGSSVITDVLVGTDGIHSATRRTMYQNLALSTVDESLSKRFLHCIDPVWTGLLVYRSLIPTERLSRHHPEAEALANDVTIHVGKNKHVVIFPVSQGRLINAIFFIHNINAFGTPFEGHWVTDVSEKEISDQFDDWEARVKSLVKCVERPSRWALHSTRALPYYARGNVALLGDAAHAMEPHFGAGAAQAMEDAIILARLLTHELTHRRNVTEALKTYERICLPFANSVVQRSQDVGRYYGFQPLSAGGSVPGHDSPEELDRLRKCIEDAWAWQSEPARMWDDAEELWRKCVSGSMPAKL